MNQSTVHAVNEDGQHDEMDTSEDCPACQPAPEAPAALAVRYCDPDTCADSRCSNYYVRWTPAKAAERLRLLHDLEVAERSMEYAGFTADTRSVHASISARLQPYQRAWVAVAGHNSVPWVHRCAGVCFEGGAK